MQIGDRSITQASQYGNGAIACHHLELIAESEEDARTLAALLRAVECGGEIRAGGLRHRIEPVEVTR